MPAPADWRNSLSVGDEVYVPEACKGTVRFIGEMQDADGLWVGVELVDPCGKCDGSSSGVRYFSCLPRYGLFCRQETLRPPDEGESDDEAPDLQPTSPLAGGLPGAVNSDSETEPTTPLKRESYESQERAPTGGRRHGVSAEAMRANTLTSEAPWEPPVHEKSADERRQLGEIIRTSHDSKMHMLFGSISDTTFEQVIDAMFLRSVAKGERVIEQGEVGQFVYIVKSGRFEVFVQRKGQQESLKVYEAGAGFAFGELALLYNAPRSATVAASTEAEVWCLERTAFRELVVRSFEQQFQQHMAFLRGCSIFSELDGDQIAALAEVVEEEDFEDDEAILEQGERDNKMYILREGKAAACIQGDQGEVEVMQYKQGDFFGEIALLTGEPRKASVYSLGPTKCIYISRDTFARLLGPLRAFLQKNISNYQQYQDVLVRQSLKEDDEQSREDLAKALTGAGKPERRKRNRATKEMGLVLEKGEASHSLQNFEGGASHTLGDFGGKAASLAEKVAEDFKNSKLVTPCKDFALPSVGLRVYGGLRLGEKFTMGKTLIVDSKATPVSDGLDDVYSWTGPAWLKGSTHAAVVCQKGQKAESDPTPNQDNFFIVHQGSVGIFGVCDGHGPFGHLVSFRLVQTLPHFLIKSPHYGKDWALALKEAFLSAQADLVSLCEAQEVNIDASGAAGTVVVFDGACFHIAHIGDAGAMLASYNRRDSRKIHGTEDHKPNLPEEKARLEDAGSEVRELDEGNWRIYLKGSNFPGLTMSRAFGDLACKGVLREPTYANVFVQPTDEVYLVLASDGIWEFITYENAVEISAKKLRLKGPMETVNFLKSASRKRWAHVCGDYCDDITCMLVQWNVTEKGVSASNTSHSLAVTRHE